LLEIIFSFKWKYGALRYLKNAIDIVNQPNIKIHNFFTLLIFF